MARSPFPHSQDPRGVSGQVFAANHTGDVQAGATAAAGAAAMSFARKLRGVADRVLTREGEADAHRVIAAEDLTGNEAAFRAGRGVDDEAFNAILRVDRLAKRQAQWTEEADKIQLAAPDSEMRWRESMQALQQGWTPSGDPEVDTAFSRWQSMDHARRLGEVRTGQERARIETARGALVSVVEQGQADLGRRVQSAGLDPAGVEAFSTAFGDFAGQLERFGPRNGFAMLGQDFAEDLSRANVMTPAQMEEVLGAARNEVLASWLSGAVERSGGSAAQQALIGQARDLYQAGEAIFAGVTPSEAERLFGGLEQIAARTAINEDAARDQAATEVRELIRAVEYGAQVDMGQLRQVAERSGSPALMAQVEFFAEYGFNATPSNIGSGSGGLSGAASGGSSDFDFAVGVLLDQLEGPGLIGNDNGRGRSQWGVTEASHPAAWRDGRIDRSEAVQIAKREYWDAIDGDNLPPDLAVAALAAAYVGGVGTAQELLAQSGGDVERFLQLEEARFRRLGGPHLQGWLNRQAKVRAAITQQRARRRATDGYTSDPIGYAAGNGTRQPMAQVAEMAPDALIDGPAAVVGDFLRQRQGAGQALNRRDGVPVRLLKNEEVTALRARIERDPQAVVTLTRRAALALGGDGARSLLGELDRAGVAGADLQLAQLSLDPAAANIVTSILNGRRLRAEQGVPPEFEDGEGIDPALRAFGAAFEMAPDLVPGLRSLAVDRAYADVPSGRQLSGRAYVNAALGRTSQNGRVFGGVEEVNRRPTILPTWLRADAGDELLRYATRSVVMAGTGPVYDNGQPIMRDVLDRAQLVRDAEGYYRLINPSTGRPYMARGGGYFRLDLEREAVREGFRARNPQLVRQ